MDQLSKGREESTEHAIVVFRKKEIRDNFFADSAKSVLYWLFNTRYRYFKYHDQEHVIYIDICASPNEIKWENFSYSTTKRYLRIVFTWILVAVSLWLCFLINKELTSQMDSNNSKGTDLLYKFYGMLCSFAIVMNNLILSNIIYYSTQ